MAQKWRNARADRSVRTPPPALGGQALEQIALRYVERYATTRAKLSMYLRRKLRERGWDGDDEPPVAPIVERFAELGYVNDASFAVARAAGLTRRGYGPRRVAASLYAAGIASEDAVDAHDATRAAAWEAALTFARRKRIGPFALAAPDRPGREKAIGAMLRAGHDLATARRIATAEPGRVPEPDNG